MIELTDETLAQAGWERDSDNSNLLRRKHDLDEYIWTEELHVIELTRLTYLQRVLHKAEAKVLGRKLRDHAQAIGKLAADSTPPLGLAKVKTALIAQGAAESIGKALSEDCVSPERLFLIRSKIVIAPANIIQCNSLQEARAHLFLMRSLGGPAIHEQ